MLIMPLQAAQDCNGCKIRGKKIFKKPLKIAGDLIVETINGINLNDLKKKLLSRRKEQIITGRYKFNAGLRTGKNKLVYFKCLRKNLQI